MTFIDETSIQVVAGNGGQGIVSFQRAAHRPKMGPDGGNGGKGGDVVFTAELNLNTLSHLRFQRLHKAENGANGGSQNKTGRGGKNCEVKVPLGTQIWLKDDSLFLGELLNQGDQLIVAKGGRGGLGNSCFTSSTNQAPRRATDGQQGEQKAIRLELKLLADVGIAGFPNAGKSTLLTKLSAARPKVGDYPFTTLHPQLGMVSFGEWGFEEDRVFADIPGLIDGASEGKGLGIRFLKHLERTRVIILLVDPTDFHGKENAVEVLETLRAEMQKYDPELFSKPFIVAISKGDLKDGMECEEEIQRINQWSQEQNVKCLLISSHTGEGLKDLKFEILKLLKNTQV